MEIRKERREIETVTVLEKDGISIFLENQDEINELFSIVNFVPIVDALSSDFIQSLYDKLSEFKTPAYTVFHDKLHKRLKKLKRV